MRIDPTLIARLEKRLVDDLPCCCLALGGGPCTRCFLLEALTALKAHADVGADVPGGGAA